MFLSIIKNPETNIDNIINMMIVIGNTSFLVPRMGVSRYLPQILTSSMQYLKDNIKWFNMLRLDVVFYLIESIGKRILSISAKHSLLN